ncbi:MAG: histidine phosphatase family protein [Pseudomonadota bacterium]
MNRVIVLLRHAQAQSAHGRQADRERRLSEHGIAQMAQVGPALAQHLAADTHVLASAATRTAETAHLLVDALGIERRAVVLDARLYDASAGALFAELQSLDDSITSLALVAHNPAISMLAQVLIAQPVLGFSTAGYAVCRYEGAWADLAPQAATLIAGSD